MKKIFLTNNNNIAIATIMVIALLFLPLRLSAQDNGEMLNEETQQLNILLNQNKHSQLQSKAEEIKLSAKKDGNPLLYYYAWRYQIIDLRNQVKLYEALQEARAMKKEVDSDKNIDKNNRQKIMFMGYELLGKIFEARGNYSNAANYLEKAIESVDDIGHNGYELSIYNALSRVYRNAEKYEQSLATAEKALKLVNKKDPTTFKLLQSKAFALYYLGRKEEFLATYNEMKQHYGDKENFDRLDIRKFAYENKFNEAHKLADKTKEERERIREHLLVYLAQKNWQSAYLCNKELAKVESSRQQEIMDKDLAEFSIKYDTERLRANNYELEIENAHTVGIFLVLFTVVVVVAIYIMWRIEKKHVVTLSKTNKELALARDKAEASDRMKTQFVQNISHEIRTPLNAIVGFSNLLSTPGSEFSDEEKAEFSETINQNTNLLTTIVDDMLELSDLQSGNAKVNISSCKCNELCREALFSADTNANDLVEMKFISEVDDSLTVNTDQRRLSLVLSNFLSNAKKYTTKGEIILGCSASKQKGYVTFSVTDTGCGIPKEKQDQLFHSFEKFDSFQQGIGLGLYLCAMTARLLNARIGIDPEYTGGSRFFISIPRQ